MTALPVIPVLRKALAAFALLALVSAPLADVTAAMVAERDVQVQRSGGGGFKVDLVMHAPVPSATAWAVLTDFEHMADFVPNLKSSHVLERHGLVMRVLQTGSARYGVFSTDFESLREIRLAPPREIRATGLGGSIKAMHSTMEVEAEPGGTLLHYHAEGTPGFWFPPLIGPALLRHETAEQFSAILREMVRRQHMAASGMGHP